MSTKVALKKSTTKLMPKGAGQLPTCRHKTPNRSTLRNSHSALINKARLPKSEHKRCTQRKRKHPKHASAVSNGMRMGRTTKLKATIELTEKDGVSNSSENKQVKDSLLASLKYLGSYPSSQASANQRQPHSWAKAISGWKERESLYCCAGRMTRA